MRLPEHEQTFRALAPSFAQVNESISLLSDIGSLSLPSKEKTMRAIYEIETRLQEQEGVVDGLEAALARIGVALRSVPRKPTLWPYAFWGTVLLAMTYVAWPWALAGVIAYAAGLSKQISYRKRKAEADRSLVEANAGFEAVAELEVTPRLKLLGQ